MRCGWGLPMEQFPSPPPQALETIYHPGVTVLLVQTTDRIFLQVRKLFCGSSTHLPEGEKELIIRAHRFWHIPLVSDYFETLQVN